MSRRNFTKFVFQRPHEGLQVPAQQLADVPQFEQVQSPSAPFDITNERLGAAHARGKLDLGQARLQAQLPQASAENFVLGSVDAFDHCHGLTAWLATLYSLSRYRNKRYWGLASRHGEARMIRCALFGLMLLLASCKAAVDRPLDTGHGQAAYRATLEPIWEQASPREQEAFNWAVESLELDELHARYPNATMREVVRGEVARARAVIPDQLVYWSEIVARRAAVEMDLRNIRASDVSFSVEKGIFGRPIGIVRATVTNGSGFAVSRIEWQATLKLEKGQAPVAQSTLFDSYRDSGGLKPGQSARRTFEVDPMDLTSPWTTLQVRSATAPQVALQVLPGSVSDFSDKRILPPETQAGATMDRLTRRLELAQQYADL